MIGQQLLTALLFYLPFVLTILFAFFTLIIGILAIFSGTLVVLLFAAYGFYCILRDLGLVQKVIHSLKVFWKYTSEDIEKNIQESFKLSGLEKLPTGTALFLCHPHGLIGYSWMLHFCYGIHTWPNKTKRPLVAIHSILFRIPIVRDILEELNCIEATEEIIKKNLHQGNNVAIVTGGIEEMLYNGDEIVKIVLKKRKGYARIANQCGVPLVAMFTKGENELFPNETFWVWNHISKLVHKWTHIQIPLPSWKSMKHWAMILKTPLEKPVETFVLGVIETKQKEESQIRNECESLYESFLKEKKIQGELIA